MRVYSFATTIVLINGVQLVGWANGDDVISIKYRNDAISDEVDMYGRMLTSVSRDISGEITFKLQTTSSGNKFLSGLLSAQRLMSFTPIFVMFKDSFSQDTASGTRGYIKKYSDIVRGANAGETEWTIIVEKLSMLLGATPAL
jgi:hypothetical protein